MRAAAAESLIIERIDTLSQMLPAAARGDVKSVHKARVATRRLRAALPIVASSRKGEAIARVIRRVTQSLGPARELDVALQILKRCENAGEVGHPAARALRTAIEHDRRQLQAELERRLDTLDFDRLRKQAARATQRPDGEGMSIRDPERAAHARVQATYRAERLVRTIDRAAALYLPDRLHAVRIAVKKLRYTLELEQRFSGSRARVRIRTLEAAQDLLGRMHDLEVLITKARETQASPAASSLAMSADLDGLVRRLERECRQLHGRYMTARQGLLSLCEGLL